LEVLAAEIGGDDLERGNAAVHPRPGGQVDVVGLDLGPATNPIPQFRRQARAIVVDESVRDLERVLAGEDGSQQWDVVGVGVVADERPSPRHNVVQDRREALAAPVDAPVLPIGRQKTNAPSGPREDLDVENNGLGGIEGVF
jgi:hypothetical protein